ALLRRLQPVRGDLERVRAGRELERERAVVAGRGELVAGDERRAGDRIAGRAVDDVAGDRFGERGGEIEYEYEYEYEIEYEYQPRRHCSMICSAVMPAPAPCGAYATSSGVAMPRAA